MAKGRPSTIGRPRVSIRVLLPQKEYEILQAKAHGEFTDVSTLVRRAIAHEYFLPNDSNDITANEHFG